MAPVVRLIDPTRSDCNVPLKYSTKASSRHVPGVFHDIVTETGSILAFPEQEPDSKGLKRDVANVHPVKQKIPVSFFP